MAWWAGVGLSAGAVLALAPLSVPPAGPGSTVPPATASPSTVSATTVSGPSSVPTGTGADTDVLGCEAALFDPSHELDEARVEQAIERTAASLGADVHVRAERTVDAGLDARMAQLEERCPTWTAGFERAPDLVVVMYSAVEREASVAALLIYNVVRFLNTGEWGDQGDDDRRALDRELLNDRRRFDEVHPDEPSSPSSSSPWSPHSPVFRNRTTL